MNPENSVSKKNEISLKEVFEIVIDSKNYLFTKWKLIIIVSVIGAALGLVASILSKTQFESRLTFVLEEDQKSSGGIASVASTFGLSGFSSGGSGLFSSINFLDFLKSRNLIESTLLSNYGEDSTKTFAQKFAELNDLKKSWKSSEKKEIKKIEFLVGQKREDFSISKDSILGVMFNYFEKHLVASQLDEDKALMEIKLVTNDQVFSKKFVEKLLIVASEYYTNSKTEKIKKSVAVLQTQTDSVRRELYASIAGAAIANDQVFGLNPAMYQKRVPSAQKQVDVQANTIILGELVKNLESSKMTLLNQTPLFQVVDKPILPLKKIKLRKIKGIMIGGVLGFLIIVFFVLTKRYILKVLA